MSRNAKSFLLDPGRRDIRLGRAASCELTISDSYVSRLHAMLNCHGSSWIITDTSTHGTEIRPTAGGAEEFNHRMRPLRHGDLLRFGSAILRFEQPDQDGEESQITPPFHPKVPVTSRQMDVLMELARPLIADPEAMPASNPTIMGALHLTQATVRGHISELYRRFDLEPGLGAIEKRVRLARSWHRAVVHDRRSPGDG